MKCKGGLKHKFHIIVSHIDLLPSIIFHSLWSLVILCYSLLFSVLWRQYFFSEAMIFHFTVFMFTFPYLAGVKCVLDKFKFEGHSGDLILAQSMKSPDCYSRNLKHQKASKLHCVKRNWVTRQSSWGHQSAKHKQAKTIWWVTFPLKSEEFLIETVWAAVSQPSFFS